ncbi:hypothetical protein M8C21_011229 [Ambrosia artemisiifolia]|uniref:DUF3741 domain-containing protein n=1 Tax=Ambrosia artemisiifolia TaxID=4212 RepID=A0AAD5GCU9_AMBAR|nr:hypothetical protein M8C21_011229 [Ambrosia artemisiifolia]
MKTLSAKDMSDKTLAKMRSPNLVAKLMGLDGLPSSQPTAKRIEQPFKHDQLNKKTTTEQQYFKDVFEDPEASSHVGNQACSPQMTAKRISAKLELGYIKERCDEMIRESIAIKTKLERVDSSPDLMLRFLHNDRQDIPFASRCNEITVLKPSSYGSRYRSSGKVLKEAVNCRGHVHVSHQRNENGHLGYSCHCNDNLYRSSRYPLERKDTTIISPTEIVVLKPNVAKNYSDKMFLHSADEYIKNRESEFYDREEVRCFRHKSREAREIARRITSQMKDGFESGHVNVHHSGHIEYASAFASESEMVAVSSGHSFHQSARPKCSHSNMCESVVIREEKTRLSPRWKTKRYKDAGMVGKSSIVEEMLSVPNSETRAHSKAGYSRGPVGVYDEYRPYGCRDGYLSTSRSRSLPPSHNQSKKVSDYYEAFADEKPMVYDKHIHRAKFRGVKGTFSHRDISRSRTLQCSNRYHSSQHSSACSPEFDNILPTETYFENNDPAEQESLISDIHDATSNAASVIDVCMHGDADSSAVDEDSLNSQEPMTAISSGTVSGHLSAPELESCEGSKAFDQDGQISVLEVSPTEDLSSGSDCFERVGSQLHELRKQLHLLKMESGTTYDSPNEDIEQRSSSCTVSESENLESTYLTDLLQSFSFYDPDPCTFITKWYSEDHHRPIDPQLYDHLEKKHSQIPRHERRLFHDRLNEAMFLLSKTMVSWSFGQRRTQMTLTESWFKDQLQKVLDMQEKDANREIEDNHISIENDLHWLKPASEIDVVCKHVAEVLVDDLVLEIVIVCKYMYR